MVITRTHIVTNLLIRVAPLALMAIALIPTVINIQTVVRPRILTVDTRIHIATSTRTHAPQITQMEARQIHTVTRTQIAVVHPLMVEAAVTTAATIRTATATTTNLA